MRKIFIGLAALVSLSFASGPAAALSAEDKKLIDKQIEDFFIRNPDKLEQALDNMQAYMEDRATRQRAEALIRNADNLYRNAADFSMGPDNAPITIVEFFDYNCGYCKRSFAPLMQVLEANKDVRLVFKEYPILGEPSYIAATTALALEDKLKYLTFHSKLMTHQGRVEKPVIDKTLNDMKLPVEKLQSDARAEKYMLHLAATRQLAEEIGVNGTPAFVINGKLFAGALDKVEFEQAIETARAELKN